MKFHKALFTFTLSLIGAGVIPTLGYSDHDSDTYLARREWVDDPFIDAREYGYDSEIYEREYDPEVFERDIDFEDDLFEREDLYLWDRSPEDDAIEYLYRRGKQQTDAYKLVVKAAGHLEEGKSYAFEMTFPLPPDHNTIPKGETANEKKLRELRDHLQYNHKALLVGTVTGHSNKLDFAGHVYDMSSHKGTLVTKIEQAEWRPSSIPLTFMGEVKAGLTQATILTEANAANADANGNPKKYGFAEWHCGLFADTLWMRIKAQ